MCSLTQRFQRFLNGLTGKPVSRLRVPRALPQLEVLEPRLVLYNLSGDAWPHPNLIALSFVPDGTNLGGATSNLFSVFNAKFGSTAAWENQILRAAQVWAQQTNLNFTVVADGGADEGAGNYQQGNPAFGDIRIGGFNFGCNALGMAYMPPQDNNYSIAGDIAFNTGQTFNLGSTYDLFTVAAHEIGHALGLYHSDSLYAVMYPTYWTTLTALASDDIAGIRAIYSNGNARSSDALKGTNNSFSTAANLTPMINATTCTNPNLAVLQTGLSINSTSQKEYFTIAVPSGSSGTLTVTAQSSGLSLLAPSLTVYNSAQTLLATKSGSGELGSTLSITLSGVSAGQQYYVVVGGANATAFGTGQYALSVNLGSGPSPTVPVPNTQTANGNPVSGRGGQAFNPLTIQGLVSGLLGLVKGVLKDGAGVFDLDVPASSTFVSPGCTCPACRGAYQEHGPSCGCPACSAATTRLEEPSGKSSMPILEEAQVLSSSGSEGTPVGIDAFDWRTVDSLFDGTSPLPGADFQGPMAASDASSF